MLQVNIENSKKRNNISDNLYDIYNELGKYELWLSRQENRELTMKTVADDRMLIGNMMKQYS